MIYLPGELAVYLELNINQLNQRTMLYLIAFMVLLIVLLVFTTIVLAVESYFWLYDKIKNKVLKNLLTFFYISLGVAFVYLYILLGIYFSD